jgi:MOSC domain-containing protein YiiM
MDKLWTTGFFKEPVAGEVFVTRTNLVGDGQADLRFHGGPDKAVLAYSADHYADWRSELEREFPPGAFGENLTIAGVTEEDVCIGDTWRIGEAVFQISQPRQPCWKLARRWRIKDLTARVIENSKSGWYFRVLEEGLIEAGQPVELISRPHLKWTVARASRLMHHDKRNRAAAAELASLPELSASWREELSERAAGL